MPLHVVIAAGRALVAVEVAMGWHAGERTYPEYTSLSVEKGLFMIIVIRSTANSEERAQLMTLLYRVGGSQRPIATIRIDEQEVIALEGSILDAQARTVMSQQSMVERIVSIKTPYKLVSRAFKVQDSTIIVGDALGGCPLVIGGAAPVVIAGPCAVENKEQLLSTARAVKAAGAQILRGGAFKPRTSPYQFQGLGIEGLRVLAEAREETGLPVVTEVMEPDMVETVVDSADLLQIGSRNMQNFPLLRAGGHNSQGRPVLLKRGLAATIEEWRLSAEYLVADGNPNVILCERGIRSFDPHTRNVLDLSCVPQLRALTHLPILVDPSHATGRRELLPAMARASIAAGADGLMIDVHAEPERALCDGCQALTPTQLQLVLHTVRLLSQTLPKETYEDDSLSHA